MAVGLIQALAQGWLNTLKQTAFTAPAGSYIKLHVGDPGVAAATTPAAGSTTRVIVTFASATTAGVLAMNGTLPVWTNAAGPTEILSHISLWDAITAGLPQLTGALTSTQSWSIGNTFTLSSLSISLSPIAA